MADHPGPEALGLAADVIDQLAFLLFFFVFDEFYLDKFVFFQSSSDGGNDFGRQTVFPYKYNWFESMGQTSEVFVLLAGKLVWHGSMLSRLWFDAACARLAGLRDAFKRCPGKCYLQHVDHGVGVLSALDGIYPGLQFSVTISRMLS